MEGEKLKQFKNCQRNHWWENVVTDRSEEQTHAFIFPHPLCRKCLNMRGFWRSAPWWRGRYTWVHLSVHLKQSLFQTSGHLGSFLLRESENLCLSTTRSRPSTKGPRLVGFLPETARKECGHTPRPSSSDPRNLCCRSKLPISGPPTHSMERAPTFLHAPHTTCLL